MEGGRGGEVGRVMELHFREPVNILLELVEDL